MMIHGSSPLPAVNLESSTIGTLFGPLELSMTEPHVAKEKGRMWQLYVLLVILHDVDEGTFRLLACFIPKVLVIFICF